MSNSNSTNTSNSAAGTDDVAVLRLHGDDGFLSAVPAMLGFHPTDSLVVMGLSSAGRVGPALRVDLTDCEAQPGVIADQIGRTLAKHVAHCAVVFYGASADREGICRRLGEHGLNVVKTLFVGNDPHEIDDRLGVAMADAGRCVQARRDDIVTSVEYAGVAIDETTREILAAMGTLADRDRALFEHLKHAADSLPDFVAACQAVPDENDDSVAAANLCAVTGILAYRTGDGALANVALDRTLRIDPKHRLAHLAMTAIMAGLPPSALDEIAAPA